MHAMLVSNLAVRQYDSYTKVAGTELGTLATVLGGFSLTSRGHGMFAARKSREPSAIRGRGHHVRGNLFFSQQLD